MAKTSKYSVQCGDVKSVVHGKTAGDAFRKALRERLKKPVAFGVLVKFRKVSEPSMPWLYIEPLALIGEK